MAKILLVEDDNNLREIYEARLMAEGYTIVSAMDGEDALVVAKKEKPDLVISDVMMPRISGFEMLDILRNTDGLKDVKVIMLTALGQAEDKTRADSLGADRYLVKSQVTLEDIVKAAQELVGMADGSPFVPEGSEAPTAETPAAPAAVPVPTPPAPVVAAPVPEPTPAPVASVPVTAPPVAVVPEPVIPTPAPVAPVPEPTPVPVAPVPSMPVTEPMVTPQPAVVPEPTVAPAPVEPAAPDLTPSQPVVPDPAAPAPALPNPFAPTEPTAPEPTPEVAPEAPVPEPTAPTVPDLPEVPGTLPTPSAPFPPVTPPAEPTLPSPAPEEAPAPVAPVPEPMPAPSTPAPEEEPAAPAAPTIPEPAASPEPSEPAAAPTSPEVQTTADEEDAVKAQIESFVNQNNETAPGAAPVTPPDPAAPPATPVPASPPAPATPAATDDALMANAVKDLISDSDSKPSEGSAAGEKVVAPLSSGDNTTMPAADVVTPAPITPAEAPAAPASENESNDDSATVAHKKIITPLTGDAASTSQPNLDELLAKEGVNMDEESHTGLGVPTTQSPTGLPATPHPPGHVISPNQGGGVDPNSIAL